MTAGIVLHALGDPAAGAPWRDALATLVGTWAAPDLPGHGETPAPRSGAYDPMAAVTIARRWLEGAGGDPNVVVGVGENALAAVVLAAGAGCGALAVVDGLHGPFRTPAAEVAAMYATLRAVAADEGATGTPPAGRVDPRATYGYGVTVSASFLQRLWGAITVPVLVVETPASTTPVAERAARASWFGGPTTIVELAGGDPVAVTGALAAWAGTVGH